MIKHTFFFWLYKWVVYIVVLESKQTDPVLVFPIYNTEYYLVWNQCMVENKLCAKRILSLAGDIRSDHSCILFEEYHPLASNGRLWNSVVSQTV